MGCCMDEGGIWDLGSVHRLDLKSCFLEFRATRSLDA
jgi:hypothetical protein